MGDARFVLGKNFDMCREVSRHKTVLLEAVVELLNPTSEGIYVDATLGGGGHAGALLEASSPLGRVLAFDRDPEAISRTRDKFARYGERLCVIHGSFEDLKDHLTEYGFETVDGIIADLGLSSDQLGDPDRGFAFSLDGPLDMRFDQSNGRSAFELVNELASDQLADILWKYGEERRSRSIANRIVRRRPVRTTRELRSAVVSVLGPRRSGIDPATRTFQALRIAVNQELVALERFLAQAPSCLKKGGCVIVISYHSLEDRAVKHTFRHQGLKEGFHVLTKKPVVPDSLEIQDNRRARSAKLRALGRAE